MIPAHNEAASIGGTLASLREQTLRPGDVLVVCDNCGDDTSIVAAGHGARIFTTQGNTARKAGALNQALEQLLPSLGGDDLILVMDADSRLNPGWLDGAASILARNGDAGAVCGVFLGEPGSGLPGQVQRNEYIRYARTVYRRRQAPVLSGTGTLFRVSALRKVAWSRDVTLPGTSGEFYNSDSITEDNEITLAMKTLGFRCLPGASCETTTEVMPTWRALFRQRLRWQKGALSDLHRYGFTGVTSIYWVRQLAIYAGFCASIACWAIMGSALADRLAMNAAWTAGIMSVCLAERLWTVRPAGRKGIVLAALVLPEMGYDLFRMAVFFRALVSELARREVAWGHVQR